MRDLRTTSIWARPLATLIAWQQGPLIPRARLCGENLGVGAQIHEAVAVLSAPLFVATYIAVVGTLAATSARLGFSYPQLALLGLIVALGVDHRD